MTTKKIPASDLSLFCSQVALILSSGLALYDGMEALSSSYSNTENAELYQKASEAVTRTGSLYEAMKEDDRWPVHLVEMVGIGERTGHLEEVMNGLTEYYAREGRIKASIRSAITYPAVMGVMMIVIVFVLLMQVLPVFRRILQGMGVAMNSTGTVLLNIGSVIGWLVLVLVALLILVLLAVVLLTHTAHRDQVLSAVAHLFRPIREIMSKLSASRISSVLSMMISSGFPVDEAVALLPPVLSDPNAVSAVKTIQASMESGKSFGDSIGVSGIYDEVHNRMIQVGFLTGKEDEVMARIAKVYEEQVEERISTLVSIIEPSLVALLCIVIGGILLSVVLPIAGIIASIF